MGSHKLRKAKECLKKYCILIRIRRSTSKLLDGGSVLVNDPTTEEA